MRIPRSFERRVSINGTQQRQICCRNLNYCPIVVIWLKKTEKQENRKKSAKIYQILFSTIHKLISLLRCFLNSLHDFLFLVATHLFLATLRRSGDAATSL
jgi:hypothetical protein